MKTIKSFVLVLLLSSSLSFSAEKAKKKYSSSDYPKFPKQTWEYFTGLLPKNLLQKLRTDYNASYITACKGRYLEDDADEYVVGFIVGKENKGIAKVFSINKQTKEMKDVVIKEFSDILNDIYSYFVPIVEVDCNEGFIFVKNSSLDGLPAYRYNKADKSFKYSAEDSLYTP